MIYLDNNATTPLAPEVFEVYTKALRHFGNASSVHGLGQEARRLVNEARERMAKAFSIPESTLVFTSGGTESLNSAMLGVFLSQEGPRHLILSSVEHSSVLQCAKYLEGLGVEVTYLEVDISGCVDPEAIQSALRPHTRMIAVMFANNEIGNIYPVKRIGEIAREHGVLFLCDAVQVVGKLEINLSLLPIDMLAGAAHKFHGPKGVGFLYLRQGLKLQPLLQGGRQERGRRPGTENVAGIVAMAEALELSLKNSWQDSSRVKRLRDKLQEGILSKFPEAQVQGDLEHRMEGTLNLLIPGIPGESALINLDREGIAVSVGAACDSGSLEPSHVLLAMGLDPKEAMGGLRFSLSRYNTDAEIDRVLEVFPRIVKQIKEVQEKL